MNMSQRELIARELVKVAKRLMGPESSVELQNMGEDMFDAQKLINSAIVKRRAGDIDGAAKEAKIAMALMKMMSKDWKEALKELHRISIKWQKVY